MMTLFLAKIFLFLPFYLGIDPAYLLITLGAMVAGMMVQGRLKSVLAANSQIPTPNGMSGEEVARKMLHDNGIDDVKIESVEGFLSDHYNPATKTVNLSPDVFNGRSITAASIAAHECGHAVQHARSYAWLNLRSTLVPITQFSSRMTVFVIIAGLLLSGMRVAFGTDLFLAGIILFGVTTLFSLITLPVEFDASRRGLAWLNESKFLQGDAYEQAKTGLHWAAMTYVVSALASIATLLYYIMLFNRSRN